MLNNTLYLLQQPTRTIFQPVRDHAVIGIFHQATPGKTIVVAEYRARRNRVKTGDHRRGTDYSGTNGKIVRQTAHFHETTNPTESDLLVLDFEPSGESDTTTLPEAEKFVTLIK